MKILFLEQFSDLGGGQRNLLDLLPAVIARGWQATVGAPGDGALFSLVRASGAATLPIPLACYSNGRKTTGDAVRFPFDSLRLGQIIANYECDAIVAGGARLLPAIALGAGGRPVVFQAQHFMEERRALRLACWAIRRARAAVIANSRYVGAQFSAAQVVYNGVAEIPFTPPASRQTRRIGIVGRIAPMKGQTDFLRAAARIAPLLPAATFVICGAPLFCPPAYIAEVEKLASGLPVEFSGWREDVGDIYRDLDLLLVPSTAAEATTRVILEAFSAGVPVIAYDVGGIGEIVRDGENGFLVPERTPEALAAKVLAVLKLDLTEIAARARRDWQRHYTIERYRQEMIRTLEPILARSPATAVSVSPS